MLVRNGLKGLPKRFGRLPNMARNDFEAAGRLPNPQKKHNCGLRGFQIWPQTTLQEIGGCLQSWPPQSVTKHCVCMCCVPEVAQVRWKVSQEKRKRTNCTQNTKMMEIAPVIQLKQFSVILHVWPGCTFLCSFGLGPF